jgi:hypothetical protein
MRPAAARNQGEVVTDDLARLIERFISAPQLFDVADPSRAPSAVEYRLVRVRKQRVGRPRARTAAIRLPE